VVVRQVNTCSKDTPNGLRAGCLPAAAEFAAIHKVLKVRAFEFKLPTNKGINTHCLLT